MPSRNRSAKACEAATLSPNQTASLTDFSDIVHASRYAPVFAFAPAPGETGMIAQGPTAVQRPPRKALRIVAGRNALARLRTDREKGKKWSGNGQCGEKRAAGDGGSKF